MKKNVWCTLFICATFLSCTPKAPKRELRKPNGVTEPTPAGSTQSGHTDDAVSQTTQPSLETPPTALNASTQNALDVVVVVDQGPSMDEGRLKILENLLPQLIDSVGKTKNLRFALISSDLGSINVLLPSATLANSTQNRQVLAVLGAGGPAFGLAALCEATKSSTGNTCGQIWQSTDILDQKGFPEAKGQLKAFARDAMTPKAFVFVSNRNSNLKAQGFLDTLGAAGANPTRTRVFALAPNVTVRSPECEATEGTVYKELTQATKGNMWEYCTPDWTAPIRSLEAELLK